MVGALLVLGSSIWLIMQALELTSGSLPIKLQFYMLRYVGVVTVPSVWLVLAMLISGYERHVNRRNIFMLTIVPVLSLLLIFTNKSHGLMFSSVTLNTTDPSLPLMVTFGPAYWALSVLYSYALMIAGFVIVTRRVMASRHSYRVFGVKLLLVPAVLWMLNVAYVIDPNVFMNFEPSSLVISVAGAVLLWKIVDLPILGVLPVAHETLIDTMNEAIFVLDGQNRIVDVNPKAQSLLGSSLERTIGVSIAKAWPEWPTLARVLDSENGIGREVTLGDGSNQHVFELHSSAIEGLIGNASYRLVTLRDATERKRMEEKLKDSEERFRSLVENTSDWIWEVDFNGTYTYSSPKVKDLLGYDAADVLGKTPFDLMPPEEAKRVAAQFADISKGRKSFSGLENTNLHRSGREVVLETSGVPILDGNGNFLGYRGIDRDITERKQIENELRRHSEHLEELILERTKKLAESESRFRELTDMLPQPVFEIDNEAKFSFVNRAGFAMTGYTEEDMHGGVNALGLVVPEDRDRLANAMMRILGGERARGYEYTVLKKNGTTFPVFLYAAPVMRGNEIAGLRGIAVDITELKRIENALRESEDRLRAIFESVNAGIMIIDPKTHTIVDANPAAIEMVGAPKHKLVGAVCHKFVCPAEKGHCPITDLGQTVDNAERMLLRVSGKAAPVLKSVTAIMNQEGYLLESFIDISERKRMEEQLLKSERLASIGETAAMVGHDLRNPLQSMTGNLYLLKKHATLEKPEERKKTVGLLSELDDAIQYMDKIVSDLQDYAQPVGPDPVETNLADLVRATLSHVKIPRSVSVTVDNRAPSNVNVDPLLLRRVLINLILNAAQAMPEGGKLTITGSTANGSLTLAVEDTGVGIARASLEKIFNPFFTTKAKGQGLGLAVCKRLIDAQGGSITVTSEVGKGSTFTFKIPIKRTTATT